MGVHFFVRRQTVRTLIVDLFSLAPFNAQALRSLVAMLGDSAPPQKSARVQSPAAGAPVAALDSGSLDSSSGEFTRIRLSDDATVRRFLHTASDGVATPLAGDATAGGGDVASGSNAAGCEHASSSRWAKFAEPWRSERPTVTTDEHTAALEQSRRDEFGVADVSEAWVAFLETAAGASEP